MIKDERIQSSMRHVASQGFWVWYILLLASLLCRQFYLRQPIDQYWDIAAIFFIGALFVSISMFGRGAVHKNAITRLYVGMLPAIIVGGVVASYFLGNITSIKELVGTIIGLGIGASLAMMAFYLLYRRWESRI
jgi:hypothetical protein